METCREERVQQNGVKGTQHAAQWSYRSQFFKMNELMVEIYSKRPVEPIGKVLHMKFSENTD